MYDYDLQRTVIVVAAKLLTCALRNRRHCYYQHDNAFKLLTFFVTHRFTDGSGKINVLLLVRECGTEKYTLIIGV